MTPTLSRTGLRGDVTACVITDAERAEGIDISALVVEYEG